MHMLNYEAYVSDCCVKDWSLVINYFLPHFTYFLLSFFFPLLIHKMSLKLTVCVSQGFVLFFSIILTSEPSVARETSNL